jgi:hypothetical protein
MKPFNLLFLVLMSIYSSCFDSTNTTRRHNDNNANLYRPDSILFDSTVNFGSMTYRFIILEAQPNFSFKDSEQYRNMDTAHVFFDPRAFMIISQESDTIRSHLVILCKHCGGWTDPFQTILFDSAGLFSIYHNGGTNWQ